MSTAGGRDAEVPAEAIQRLRSNIADDPGQAWPWGQLACALDALDRREEAVDAAARAVELRPDAKLRDRLSGVLARACRLDRSELALAQLRLLASGADDQVPLARALEDMGLAQEAEAVWRGLLQADPYQLEAYEHLARNRQTDGGLRIAVVGTCQACTVAESLRRQLPGAWVAAYWRNLRPGDEAAWFTRQLETFDVVLSQPDKSGRSTRAAAYGFQQAIGFPQLVFTGFHPDLEHLGKAKLGHEGPFKAWHSRSIMAAFALGLDERRAADLFNAFTYGVLGYFDEYPAARVRLDSEVLRAGLQPLPLEGVFMYDPVHPTPQVLWTLAQAVCRKLGHEPAQAEAPSLRASSLVWPVYPEIAKRLGVPGSLSFSSIKGDDLTLEDVIAQSYARYAAAGAQALLDLPRVAQAVAALRPYL